MNPGDIHIHSVEEPFLEYTSDGQRRIVMWTADGQKDGNFPNVLLRPAPTDDELAIAKRTLRGNRFERRKRRSA